MEPNLKRIEATTHQLKTVSAASYPKPAASRNRTYSFEICRTAQNRDAPDQTSGKVPTLPKFNNPRFSNHRNNANSALAMKPLPKIQTDVAACEAELKQIVRQIKQTYMEGPLVDGWLESYPRSEPEPATATLRHGLVDRLIDYLNKIFSIEQGKVNSEAPLTGYRLCGLDAAGNMWSHHCPMEQLASVSIAIARYQKLRQLLSRKQNLENRLNESL